MSRTIIPFGPQHPVLPEPIHLQLVMDNETVVEALPKLGYVHRLSLIHISEPTRRS